MHAHSAHLRVPKRTWGHPRCAGCVTRHTRRKHAAESSIEHLDRAQLRAAQTHRSTHPSRIYGIKWADFVTESISHYYQTTNTRRITSQTFLSSPSVEQNRPIPEPQCREENRVVRVKKPFLLPYGRAIETSIPRVTGPWKKSPCEAHREFLRVFNKVFIV